MIDSMGYWCDLGREYLNQKGITENLEQELIGIEALTTSEAAALFIDRFSLPGDAETVAGEINSIMDQHYQTDIPLKPGVKAHLNALKGAGVRMCVASATAKHLMEACLDRLGILSDFEFILSCEDLESSKREPKIYLEAAGRFGAAPEVVAVYEDALYAAETAKRAGFYVVGVYEDSAAQQWRQLCDLTDEVIRFD